MGQVWEGTSPRWAGAPPQGPKAPRVWGGGRTHLTWGASFPSPPLGRPSDGILGWPPPLGWNSRWWRSPPLPLYIVEAKEQPIDEVSSLVGAALPLFLLISHGAWRSLAGSPCSSTTTTLLCCCWMESSSTSPSLLAGSRHGRRHRAVRVLNVEVPSVRH